MEKLKEMLGKYGIYGTLVIVLASILIALVTGCGHFSLKATDIDLKSTPKPIERSE